MRLMVEIPIYGRIASLKALKPEGKATDSLMVSTETHKVVVLSFDAETQKVITEATGDVRDAKARPAENGHVSVVDPQNRLVGFHISQGTFKVIPMFHSTVSESHWRLMSPSSSSAKKSHGSSSKGKQVARMSLPGEFGEAFNIRLDELQVLSIALLDTPKRDASPLLTVLYQDSRNARHLSEYKLNLKDKQSAPTHTPIRVENGAHMLITVAATVGGGVIVVGEQSISLYSEASVLSLPIPMTLVTCYDAIDANRFLLSDYEGFLYIFVMLLKDGLPYELKMEKLGETVHASCLAYLTDGYVFVGSHYGDSELYSLLVDKNDQDNNLMLHQSFLNMAPITDFCLVDLEKQGEEHIVACCGAYKDASLRIIRNGIGVEEIGRLEEMHELTGVWSLRPSSKAKYDTMLVLSFISETRIQRIESDNAGDVGSNAMSEVEHLGGFLNNEQSLLCQNVPGDCFVQITRSRILLLKCDSFAVCSQWQPSSQGSDAYISHTSVVDGHIVVSLGGGGLVHLEANTSKLRELKRIKLPNEISCLHANKLSSNGQYLCAVGCWGDSSIRLLSVPNLTTIQSEILPEETISRSILLIDFDHAVDYLLVSLGDGKLFTFRINEKSQFSDCKKITVGTQPIALKAFKSGGCNNVFAASDRPVVIHYKSGQLVFSNVNMREVSCICPFNTAAAEDSLALLSEGILKLGSIEAVQKLHIKTVHLDATARRIVHHQASGTFGILTLSNKPLVSARDGLGSSSFRILDQESYEALDVFDFKQHEVGTSLATIRFGDDEMLYYAVGTGVTMPDSDEPEVGRILIFAVAGATKKLRLVHEYETRGCAYSLCSTAEGILLAGVNSKILVLKWDKDALVLTLGSVNYGHVLTLILTVKDDLIVAGDLMKSMAVFKLNPATLKLEDVARDHDTIWMTALEAVSDSMFVGADSSFNLYALRRECESESAEERKLLKPASHFHLGQTVNRFRRGSLSSNAFDDMSPAKPEIIYCTVNGGIGILATLDTSTYLVLDELQSSLRDFVQGVGSLSHAEWRTFRTERRLIPDHGIIDGDLIESFLSLDKQQQETVASSVKQVSLTEITKLVEDLMRIH